MNVAFAGTPEFAAVALTTLQAAGFRIGLVMTQPDRPAGRGMKLQVSPVKAFALAREMPVLQPRSLRFDGRFPADATLARAALQAIRPDVIVVAAYGLLLPPWMLELPRLGCLNIHASLLPRWRGAAPIHRAIEAGDASTGITIMQMDAGLDTGATLLAARVEIAPADTTGSLHDRLAPLGGQLIAEALGLAACGALVATVQPAEGISYAPKIDKAEAAIDWRQPADEIERRLRAFDPFPGATAVLDGETLKCWRGLLAEASGASGASGASAAAGAPGEVLAADEAGLTVACGSGALRLIELQRPGARRMTAREFLQGRRVPVGAVFEAHRSA